MSMGWVAAMVAQSPGVQAPWDSLVYIKEKAWAQVGLISRLYGLALTT